MNYVNGKTTALHYEYHRHTNPDAKTIVMIHGAGLQGSFWLFMVPLLQTRYSLLIYDLPSHGQSGDTAEPLTWESLIGDLHILLEALELSRVNLIGHDFGAQIAMRFTSIHENRVESLILLSPLLYYPVPALLKELRRKFLLPDAARLPSEAGIAAKITKRHTETLMNERIVKSYHRVPRHVYQEILSLVTDSASQPPRCPEGRTTLLLSGQEDAVFTPVLAGLTCAFWGTCTYLIVPDASNLTFVDQPIYTSDWIDAFIRKQSGSGAIARIYEVDRQLKEILHTSMQERMLRYQADGQIRIQCLGRFEVTVNGTPLEEGWNTRYAKSLLVLLAFHPIVTREQICEWLFPELNVAQAMRNLRVYLNHFAKLLEPGQGQSPCVTIDRNTVQLHYAVDCDLVDILQDLQEALPESSKEKKLTLCSHLLKRLSCKILPGCYDPFTLSLQENIEHLWEILVNWAVDYCLQHKKPMDAIPFLQSGLQYNPTDELRYYDRLMEVYQATGQTKDFQKWSRKKKQLLARMEDERR